MFEYKKIYGEQELNILYRTRCAGLSYREIADEFGTNPERIKWAIKRRGRLLSKKYFPEIPDFVTCYLEHLPPQKHFHFLRQQRAHQLFRIAKAKGLVRPSPGFCEKCGSGGPLDGHHPEYSDPTSVIYLCRQCHFDSHKELRRSMVLEFEI